MSRDVKRVPEGFDWPMGQAWSGYLCPINPQTCNPCDGDGNNPETHQIAEDFYGFNRTGRRWVDAITQDEVQALVDRRRLVDYTHTWKQGSGWTRRDDEYIPSAHEINEANRTVSFFGHDAINRLILIETRAKRLGVWGKCSGCGGIGQLFASDAQRKAYEEWEGTEPPEGEWYQMWETTSEGSPISPPCESPESLADWLAANNASAASGMTSTRAEWLTMIKEGSAFSLMSIPGVGVVSGVAALSEPATSPEVQMKVYDDLRAALDELRRDHEAEEN